MTDKFNPAPHDKHAEKGKEQKNTEENPASKLDKQLEDSFPASDPPSVTQPSKSCK